MWWKLAGLAVLSAGIVYVFVFMPVAPTHAVMLVPGPPEPAGTVHNYNIWGPSGFFMGWILTAAVLALPARIAIRIIKAHRNSGRIEKVE